MKTYTYKGKNKSAVKNKSLLHGGIYQLDEKNPHVQSLEAQGLLEEIKSKKDDTKKQKKK